MYYYSVLLLLTRCEEEKQFYKGGWRIKSQSTLCRPASQWVRGCRTVFNILNAWSCQTFFLYSNFLFVCVWKDLFFFFGSQNKCNDTECVTFTTMKYSKESFSICIYLFFLWGPLFSRRRRRPVVIRARDLFCRFLRMCDVRPSNLFGSRVECNSWLAPLPKSQTGKWLASACRSIDNIPHPKKSESNHSGPFFSYRVKKRENLFNDDLAVHFWLKFHPFDDV